MWNMILPDLSKMDQVRNFYSANQSSVLNILYLAAFAVLVYYLFLYYKKSTSFDVDLLKTKLEITGKRPTAADDLKKYSITVNDGKEKMDLRAKNTGAYTLSYWIYITRYSETQTGYQSIMAFTDGGKVVDGDIQSLLVFALHPNQPKMFVHVGCLKDITGANVPNMERIGNGTWRGIRESVPTEDTATSCNIVDIEMNRWLHIAVSVNKQIVDVFLDGKLSRSCVLPQPQDPSVAGPQTLQILPSDNSFQGYMSGIHFSAYVATPDQIYAAYLAGPYAKQDFYDYISEKIGIRLQYTGAAGAKETSDWNLKTILLDYFPPE